MNDNDSMIVKRLDAIISLQIRELQSKEDFSSGKIYTDLHNAGLTPSEIGKIVGREGKDIAATITMHKKHKTKNHKTSKGKTDG